MGVFRQGINFTAIGAEMAATAAAWFNGSVKIIDPNQADAIWDPVTNTETPATETVIWSGTARIQPIGANSTPDVGFAQLGVRQVRVQVPVDDSAGFIRKGLIVEVVDGGNDYALNGLRMTVTGATNSSYAWLRTIMCEVDVKLGPGGD